MTRSSVLLRGRAGRRLVQAIALGLALGCSSAPVVRPDPIVVREPCLVESPPAWGAVKVAGPEEGCPEAFEACLSLEEAARLDAQVRALRRWAREAWEGCGRRR